MDDHGLCDSLAPASLIVGDSVSSQFFRALIEMLGGTRHARPYKGEIPIDCDDAGCNAMRALPAYAQRARLCDGNLWLAYIRNDWTDVALSYRVSDPTTGSGTSSAAVAGNLSWWHCAQTVDELAPELRRAVRQTTHACGPPTPHTLSCQGVPCLNGAAISPTCASICMLASYGVSCGRAQAQCEGCSSTSLLPTLCDTIGPSFTDFCASTATPVTADEPDGSNNNVRPTEGEHYYMAHCQPWASSAMLRHFRVLVLNSGAHRVPLAAYQRQMHRLRHVIQSFLSADPPPQLPRPFNKVAVWRTSVPGFSGCNTTHHAKPHKTVAQAEAYLAAHPFYEQHVFMPPRNRIAAVEVQKAGGYVLDVYPGSILRIDDRSGIVSERGVMDCLHYRPPYLASSLGLWARMLGDSLQRRGAT